MTLCCVCAPFLPRALWPAPRQGCLMFVFFGPRLGASPPQSETARSGRGSFRRPGSSRVMECLLPVSGRGSAIYSTMTDRPRMDWRVSMPSPATSQAARSYGASTNEAVQETQRPKFSCEPWPPTGEERGPLKKKTAGFWFQDLNTAITRQSSVSAQGTTCGEQLCPVRLISRVTAKPPMAEGSA